MLSSDDQEKLLSEAVNAVKVQAFQMKRCLDKNKLMDALKHASTMLSELRASLLSPKSYYQLFIEISNQLSDLQSFLMDEFEKGNRIEDLYELVQYAGNIVPRLYLLITVGLVYIRHHEYIKKDILKDLVEMCRGVQHPLRGLFLRNYLLMCTKDVMPDCLVGDEEASDGTVDDSIEFILLNFAEMNKLWVRMQHQGHSRDRERRERERNELKILVGTNLVRLSQLDNIDVEKYTKVVLPGVLEQVVSCRDPIAQEYLMECIIQVFPDEMHLASLHNLLNACSQLQPRVNVKNVITALIDRLAKFAERADSPGIPEHIQLFDIFSAEITNIIGARDSVPPDDIVCLQVSLINMAHKCYPGRNNFIDTVLAETKKLFENIKVERVEYGTPVGREMEKLLLIPITSFNDILTVLQLSNFSPLLNIFDFEGRKAMSCVIANNVINNETKIDTADKADTILTLLAPLIHDQPDGPTAEQWDDPEEFIEEQGLIARLSHLLVCEDIDEQLSILAVSKKHFVAGGVKRIGFTLPSIVMQSFQFAKRIHLEKEQDAEWETKVAKLFQFAHNTISALVKAEMAELPMRLYLQGALVLNDIDYEGQEEVAYEYLSQAFSLYEDEISDSRAQLSAITLIVGTLEQLHCFGDENHDVLRSQYALAASKLLKKPDQCRALQVVSHVFWSGKKRDGEELKDEKKLLECLKKCLKVASQCMDAGTRLQLFVEVLNKYMYFYEKGAKAIDDPMLQELINRIKEESSTLEVGDEAEFIKEHFSSTLDRIKLRKTEEGLSPNYRGVNID